METYQRKKFPVRMEEYREIYLKDLKEAIHLTHQINSESGSKTTSRRTEHLLGAAFLIAVHNLLPNGCFDARRFKTNKGQPLFPRITWPKMFMELRYIVWNGNDIITPEPPRNPKIIRIPVVSLNRYPPDVARTTLVCTIDELPLFVEPVANAWKVLFDPQECYALWSSKTASPVPFVREFDFFNGIFGGHGGTHAAYAEYKRETEPLEKEI